MAKQRYHRDKKGEQISKPELMERLNHAQRELQDTMRKNVILTEQLRNIRQMIELEQSLLIIKEEIARQLDIFAASQVLVVLAEEIDNKKGREESTKIDLEATARAAIDVDYPGKDEDVRVEEISNDPEEKKEGSTPEVPLTAEAASDQTLTTDTKVEKQTEGEPTTVAKEPKAVAASAAVAATTATASRGWWPW